MKAALIVLILLSLSACISPPTPPPALRESALPSNTFTPEIPTSPSPQLTTMTAEVIKTGTPLPCLHLLAPVDDAILPSIGRVEFEWESQAGATFYVLTFTYPNELLVDFKTLDTGLARYMETMPKGGTYKWTVTAYASNEKRICSSASSTFSKEAFSRPEHEAEAPSTPEEATAIAPPEAPPTHTMSSP